MATEFNYVKNNAYTTLASAVATTDGLEIVVTSAAALSTSFPYKITIDD